MTTKIIDIPLLKHGEAPDLSRTHVQKLFPESNKSHPLIYVEQLTQATDTDPPYFMGRVRGIFGVLLDEIHGTGLADVLFHARRRFLNH